MARKLSFSLAGKQFEGSPTKVDRKKLYGWSETVALDESGRECQVVSVDETGTLIIPQGGVGLGILTDDHRWVDRSELKAVTSTGLDAELQPSSYDDTIQLVEQVTATQLLDHSVTGVYKLEDIDPTFAAALGDDIFAFDYFFRAGYSGNRAFLVANGDAIFMLVGYLNDFEMLILEQASGLEAEEPEESDDLDFSFI